MMHYMACRSHPNNVIVVERHHGQGLAALLGRILQRCIACEQEEIEAA